MKLRKWRTFRTLPCDDLWGVTQAWLAMPCVAILLRVAGVRGTQRLLRKTARIADAADGDHQKAVEQVQRIARLVGIAARNHVKPPNCLLRSLVLWWLLRRHGFESVIRFGARQGIAGFEAHAWVEFQNAVVGEGPQNFEPFVPPPRSECALRAAVPSHHAAGT